jgi:mRNA interferase HigB
MRVISLKPLRAFWGKFPDAELPLRHWYRIAISVRWRSLQDVRKAYPHADGVRTRKGDTLTVINIGGNKYRLLVRIRYDFQLINVRCLLTHREYDEGDWRE